MSDVPEIVAETPNPALMLGGQFAQLLHERLRRPVIDLRDNSIFPALGQICMELGHGMIAQLQETAASESPE